QQILTMIEDGYTDKETVELLLNELNEKKSLINKTEEHNNPNTTYTPNYKTSSYDNYFYTVKNGDTLSEILYDYYGTYSLSAIKAVSLINGIKNVNKLTIGENIKLPPFELIKLMRDNGELENITVANWPEAQKDKDVPSSTNTETQNDKENSIDTNKETTISTEDISAPATNENIEQEVVTEDIPEPVVNEITEPESEIFEEKVEDTLLPKYENTEKEGNKTDNLEEEIIVEEIMQDEEFVSEMISSEPELVPTDDLAGEEVISAEPELAPTDDLAGEEVISAKPELAPTDDLAGEEIIPTEDNTTIYDSDSFNSSMFDTPYFNSLEWHLNMDNMIDDDDEEDIENETKDEEIKEETSTNDNNFDTNTEVEKDENTTTPSYSIEEIVVAYITKER
nr:LysM peptidoglycan-binding domain-containing protein [bacterium]